ncbi:glycosyltransferase [Bowdeniella nasicola]|uniref:glycosyltransferase family protein n=1 Tax=Bowdeniella nasicola TaxID=208480 RepID=UPI00115FB444|nr:glycosyltransferase [Bowdeniella nasicola]
MRSTYAFLSDISKGPYGTDILADLDITARGISTPTSRAVIKARNVVHHRSGIDFYPAIAAAKALRGSDIVVGLLEHATQAAAILKGRSLPPYRSRPLVMISCWLAHWLQTKPTNEARKLVHRFRSVDLILTLSRNQIPILEDAGFSPEQLGSIPFGCEPRNFLHEADAPRDIPVLAAGFDHGRDYRTFFDGVRDLDVPITLLCQEANIRDLDIPTNVEVKGVVPYDEYRNLIRRARVVAVPTKELAYPTGQSVALDAGAAGAALIVTGTTAMREYFSEENATLVDVADSAGWRAAVSELVSDDERRQRQARTTHDHVLGSFTNHHMWRSFQEQIAAHGL